MLNKRRNLRVSFYLFIVAICVLLPAGSYLKTNSQDDSSAPIEIKVTAKQFSYEPKTITVRNGQRVKLILSTSDVEHSFAIREFNIDVPVKPHQIKTIYFTPNRTGTFRFICTIYCGADHRKMSGELIVTD